MRVRKDPCVQTSDSALFWIIILQLMLISQMGYESLGQNFPNDTSLEEIMLKVLFPSWELTDETGLKVADTDVKLKYELKDTETLGPLWQEILVYPPSI